MCIRDRQINRPPVNRKRKVIFNQQTKLTTNEKLQIVGQLIGRSTVIKIEDIYQCMLNLNESNKKITWTAVASLLNCSVRTVYRNLNKELKIQCKDTDQPSAALIMDLKQRGLLEDTLVIWGGEFGRTNYTQGVITDPGYGRDHHPRCFTIFMAGAGIK